MFRRRPYILAALGLAAMVGCQDAKDVTGRWTFSFPPSSMDLTLTPDGRYSGTVSSPMGESAASGTYGVDGDTITLSAPPVAGATGLPTTFGGQISLRMNRLSPMMIRLSDGKHEFGMERTGF